MGRETQLIFGFHAVNARLRHHPGSVVEIFVHAGRHDPRIRDLLATALERGVRAVPLDAQRLQGLVGHAKHQGVIARVEPVHLGATLEDVVAARGWDALAEAGVTNQHYDLEIRLDGDTPTEPLLAAASKPQLCRACSGQLRHRRGQLLGTQPALVLDRDRDQVGLPI